MANIVIHCSGENPNNPAFWWKINWYGKTSFLGGHYSLYDKINPLRGQFSFDKKHIQESHWKKWIIILEDFYGAVGSLDGKL